MDGGQTVADGQTANGGDGRHMKWKDRHWTHTRSSQVKRLFFTAMLWGLWKMRNQACGTKSAAHFPFGTKSRKNTPPGFRSTPITQREDYK
ncbi:hypothetical protein QJS10_CPA06g02438 [Acorus calamus]|uniref:Uncharacterized protein n=1 Tax=Acorus calamus TaxID=4465 RepID=A0AAV9EMD6_ACOCL|nr:hypothetical protein QJS10_CPA06g02438 [Acorus calamus]